MRADLHIHSFHSKDNHQTAQEIFKVEGAYAPEKTENLSINIDIKKQEELKVIAKQVIKTLRDGTNRSDK